MKSYIVKIFGLSGSMDNENNIRKFFIHDEIFNITGMLYAAANCYTIVMAADDKSTCQILEEKLSEFANKLNKTRIV